MKNSVVKKNNIQKQIEINHRPSIIGRNDQNQSNKKFNFNLERCGPKGSNTKCSQKTPNHNKLRMQSTLISMVKKKNSPENIFECEQEKTVAEIEKTIKSFENNNHPVMMVYLRNFIKLLMKYLKQTYISCTLKFSNQERCREACSRQLYPVCTKKETISLLNYNNKIYIKILANKIKPTLDDIIGPDQQL